MSYSAGEALILTQIQATSTFGSTNSSRANWKILNKGTARSHAIIRYGPFERQQNGMGGNYQTNWVTLCEVWVRYIDDSTTQIQLESAAAEIIERFDSWRLAGDSTGNIQDVFVRRGDEPQEMWTNNGDGPSWVRQILEIEWQELRTATIQE